MASRLAQIDSLKSSEQQRQEASLDGEPWGFRKAMLRVSLTTSWWVNHLVTSAEEA